MKKLAFDLDGTLCAEGPGSERMFAEPIVAARNLVNRAYAAGHHVVIFTARCWADYRMTHDWLTKHGFQFHQLLCGKYNYDRLLDDRACNRPEEMEAYLYGPV